MTDIRTLLHSGLVYLDGGMGTLLQVQGMKPGEAPERWGLTHRETIRGIHRAYFDAGSHIVMANTFGVNPVRYDAATMETMVRTAVEDAREARKESAAPQAKFVALDLGPTGQLLKPFGPLGFEEAVAAFAQVVRLGAEAGVDHVHPHKFRRTLATGLARHGMPIQEVATLLGHEKLDTTMRYVNVDREDTKYTYRRFS